MGLRSASPAPHRIVRVAWVLALFALGITAVMHIAQCAAAVSLAGAPVVLHVERDIADTAVAVGPALSAPSALASTLDILTATAASADLPGSDHSVLASVSSCLLLLVLAACLLRQRRDRAGSRVAVDGRRAPHALSNWDSASALLEPMVILRT